MKKTNKTMIESDLLEIVNHGTEDQNENQMERRTPFFRTEDLSCFFIPLAYSASVESESFIGNVDPHIDMLFWLSRS